MGDERARVVAAAGEQLERFLVVGHAPARGGVGDGADHCDFAPQQGEGVEPGVVDREDAEDDDSAEPPHGVDRGANRVRVSADALGDHVDRVVRRELREPLFARFVVADDLDRAEPPGGFLLVRMAGEHDHLRTVGLRGELGGEADAAAADHQHRFSVAELDFLEAVHGAGERLGDGGQFAVDARGRGEDGFGGREQLLGHPAVHGDADEAAGDLALVVAPGDAVPAAAAAQERFDADYIALAQAGYAGARGGDHAADLVAGRARGLGRKVAAVPVQVGAADAGVDHLHEHFALARRALGLVEHAQRSVCIPGCSAHCSPPLQRAPRVRRAARLAAAARPRRACRLAAWRERRVRSCWRRR